jgi:hypothetical protein
MGGLGFASLKARGGTITGQLHRVQLRLLADEGDHVEVDAATLIPE